ncbi:hypothetical protein EON65_17375 [archaeon]|nr:MAG: hypothetical protein EON65_17375 [archaeon]
MNIDIDQIVQERFPDIVLPPQMIQVNEPPVFDADLYDPDEEDEEEDAFQDYRDRAMVEIDILYYVDTINDKITLPYVGVIHIPHGIYERRYSIADAIKNAYELAGGPHEFHYGGICDSEGFTGYYRFSIIIYDDEHRWLETIDLDMHECCHSFLIANEVCGRRFR